MTKRVSREKLLESLSTKELKELLKKTRAKELALLKEKCIELCKTKGYSLGEVFFSGKERTNHCPTYLDPITGKTWSGRGRRPSWVKPEVHMVLPGTFKEMRK